MFAKKRPPKKAPPALADAKFALNSAVERGEPQEVLNRAGREYANVAGTRLPRATQWDRRAVTCTSGQVCRRN